MVVTHFQHMSQNYNVSFFTIPALSKKNLLLPKIAMDFQRRKRPSTGDKFSTPKFDHLLLWYPKTNSHSGTLYVNSACLSHYNPAQKAAFQVQQTVTIHEGQEYHPAIILKVGTQSEVRISEQIVDQLAEQGYSTDRILSVLKNDVEIDSDDEARDETYEPPCQQTPELSSSPKSSVHNQNSASKKQCIEASPIASIQCSSASKKACYEAAKEADLLRTFGGGSSKMTDADASGHRVHNSILGSTSENVAVHKKSSSARPVETQPDGRAPSSYPQKEPLSAAQQLLVEYRMNNHLLKKSIKLQEETVQILKQAFLPQRSSDSKEDRTYTGHDGRLYRLSLLPVGITQFAREYVLQRYGEEFCATIILEPHGKTDRIAADQTVIEDIRGMLDYWYGTYSWNAVRS